MFGWNIYDEVGRLFSDHVIYRHFFEFKDYCTLRDVEIIATFRFAMSMSPGRATGLLPFRIDLVYLYSQIEIPSNTVWLLNSIYTPFDPKILTAEITFLP